MTYYMFLDAPDKQHALFTIGLKRHELKIVGVLKLCCATLHLTDT